MNTYILICSMLCTAGCSVRFTLELAKERPHFGKLIWCAIEIIALGSIFRFCF
jgi:hypothetical protein